VCVCVCVCVCCIHILEGGRVRERGGRGGREGGETGVERMLGERGCGEGEREEGSERKGARVL
jgi:hypothetical protein